MKWKKTDHVISPDQAPPKKISFWIGNRYERYDHVVKREIIGDCLYLVNEPKNGLLSHMTRHLPSIYNLTCEESTDYSVVKYS